MTTNDLANWAKRNAKRPDYRCSAAGPRKVFPSETPLPRPSAPPAPKAEKAAKTTISKTQVSTASKSHSGPGVTATPSKVVTKTTVTVTKEQCRGVCATGKRCSLMSTNGYCHHHLSQAL